MTNKQYFVLSNLILLHLRSELHLLGGHLNSCHQSGHVTGHTLYSLPPTLWFQLDNSEQSGQWSQLNT